MRLAPRVRVGVALHALVNLASAAVLVAGAAASTPALAWAEPALASTPVLAVVAPAAPEPTADPPPAPASPDPSSHRRVQSTGYCLDGIAASGRPPAPGEAAMNGVPLGTRVRIHDGPLAGTVVVVTDRIGHGSDLDVWFAECAAAVTYGRRIVTVELLG